MRLLRAIAGVLRGFLRERKRLKDEARIRSQAGSISERLPGLQKDQMPQNNFDKIFLEEGRDLPLPFLRALAYRESRNNPLDANGPAWGLMQVGIDKRAGNVLQSYNQRLGKKFTKQDMLNPRLNVRVAAELLSRIVAMYKDEGLEADWTNGNFIGLVTAGWNAGYSRKAGMVKLIRYLKSQEIPVTLSAAYKNAPRSGAGKGFIKRMGQARREKWTRAVVRSTFKEQGLPAPAAAKSSGTNWLPLLMAILLLKY